MASLRNLPTPPSVYGETFWWVLSRGTALIITGTMAYKCRRGALNDLRKEDGLCSEP